MVMKKEFFYKLSFFVVAIAFLLFFGANKIKAIDYVYESGVVEQKHNGVVVNSFSYDYTVTFYPEDKMGDFNGEKVYGGRKILLSVDEYSKWWPFTKDDDKTLVYKYDGEKNAFDSILTSFKNEKNTLELNSPGLYKVEYVFEGSVVSTNYIYISLDIHSYSIKCDERYLSMPVFSKFNFRLILKDGYDLRKNQYYYAFGEDFNSLSYKSLDVFSEEEKESTEKVNLIDRELTVSVSQKDETLANKKKYLFVKIVDTTGKETIIKSADSYEIDSKIQANVYVEDVDGTVIEDESVYKQGEVIYFKVLLNVPVTYTNLLYTVDGDNYVSLDDVSEPVSEIKIEHKVNSLVNFWGKFNLRSKNNVNAIVKNEGVNASLNVIVKSSFKVDVIAPVINLTGEGNSEGKSGYSLNLSVGDENIERVKYYAKKCGVFEEESCVEKFDDNNSNVIDIGGSSSAVLFIGDNFGKFNGENLTVYIKAIDKAGNYSTFAKSGFVVDNVIVEDIEAMFVEENILEGSLVSGKSLKVVFPLEYKVSNVGYSIGEGSLNNCNVLVEGQQFECIRVENYPLFIDMKIVVEDFYGNKEYFAKNFSFSLLEDEEFAVDGLHFISYNNKNYEIEFIYSNSMRTDVEKIIFGDTVFSMFEDKLYLNDIPNITKLTKNLIYIDGEYRVELVRDVSDNLTLFTLEEVLQKIMGDDERNRCAFEACNVDLYLEYKYQTTGIDQVRLIKIAYVDNSNNFYIENFEEIFEIDVGKEFDKLEYIYRDNLNVGIDSENVEKIKKIIFVDKQGNQSIVDYVDTKVVGRYMVEEFFINNNVKSFPLKYMVDVVDKQAPNIKLNGKDKIYLEVGDSFEDPLIMASDNYDEEVEIIVESSPVLDLNKSGKYVIKYWAVDSNGNVSRVVSRLVVVEEKNNFTLYLISGGIGAFTALVVVMSIFIERKKSRKSKNKKEENLN